MHMELMLLIKCENHVPPESTFQKVRQEQRKGKSLNSLSKALPDRSILC